MLLGWAALAGGPLAGWALGAADANAVAYGGTPARWPAVLGAAVPSAFAAALLLLNGALRARARAARGALALRGADRALVEASRWAGWACVALCAFALGTAMLLGGPLGLIGGFGLLIVLFSLAGRGRAPAPGYRVNPGRPRDIGDPRNN
jgi:hypothetical protein